MNNKLLQTIDCSECGRPMAFKIGEKDALQTMVETEKYKCVSCASADLHFIHCFNSRSKYPGLGAAWGAYNNKGQDSSVYDSLKVKKAQETGSIIDVLNSWK